MRHDHLRNVEMLFRQIDNIKGASDKHLSIKLGWYPVCDDNLGDNDTSVTTQPHDGGCHMETNV